MQPYYLNNNDRGVDSCYAENITENTNVPRLFFLYADYTDVDMGWGWRGLT